MRLLITFSDGLVVNDGTTPKPAVEIITLNQNQVVDVDLNIKIPLGAKNTVRNAADSLNRRCCAFSIIDRSASF